MSDKKHSCIIDMHIQWNHPATLWKQPSTRSFDSWFILLLLYFPLRFLWRVFVRCLVLSCKCRKSYLLNLGIRVSVVFVIAHDSLKVNKCWNYYLKCLWTNSTPPPLLHKKWIFLKFKWQKTINHFC